ncbi:hypothetical protein [uncultured Helicobacter sp.]|uniref:hypothetical protein n=1 Tax=uncultured Helicobacter sp. TaxID=175537 RepID=UPI00374F7D69
MNTESNSKAILIFILTFGIFSILSTELGAMGLIPILQIHFGISAADAGWAVSIFALMITLCAPIVPLLCAGFNQKKKLMLVCLAVSLMKPHKPFLLF